MKVGAEPAELDSFGKMLASKLDVDISEDNSIFGKIKRIATTVFETVTTKAKEIFNGVENAWKEDVKPAIDKISEILTRFINGPLNDLLVWLGLASPAGAGTMAMVGQAINGKSGLETTLDNIKTAVENLASKILVELIAAFLEIENQINGSLGTALDDLWAAIDELITALGLGDDDKGGHTLERAIRAVGTAMTWFIEYVLTPMVKLATKAVTAFRELYTAVEKFVTGWNNKDVGGMLSGIGGAVAAGVNATAPVSTSVSKYLLGDKLYDWLSGNSGGNQAGAWRVPNTGTRFLHEGEMILPPDVSNIVRSAMMNPVSASPVTNNTSNSVQFGDVSVGSTMDMAMLQWAVEGALRNAL